MKTAVPRGLIRSLHDEIALHRQHMKEAAGDHREYDTGYLQGLRDAVDIVRIVKRDADAS